MRIFVVVATIFFSLPSTAWGGCVSSTECFCRLVPLDSESLLYVEVIAAQDGTVDIKLLEEPFQDPGGQLHLGDEILGVDSGEFTLQTSEKGLFRIATETSPSIAALVIEQSGMYPCEYDPEFAGATKEDVVAAVLSQDCSAAVYALGLKEGECDDTESSCAACGSSPRNGSGCSWLFLLACLFSLHAVRRGSRGKN